MNTYVLFGVDGGSHRVIISVRAENVRDAAKKLKGELHWCVDGRKTVGTDAGAHAQRGDEGLHPLQSGGAAWSYAAFQPSSDTADVIAEAKRGRSHDPFDGGNVDIIGVTAKTESVWLMAFDRFTLCEIPCIQ